MALVEKDANGGRKLTSQGRRDMDRIAAQIAKVWEECCQLWDPDTHDLDWFHGFFHATLFAVDIFANWLKEIVKVYKLKKS